MKPSSIYRTTAYVALGLSLATNAFGFTVGVSASAGPVVNPFTGKQTDAWKLVGKAAEYNCSAFQISREWVMSSVHCALEDGVHFKNGFALTAAGSRVYACEHHPDFSVNPDLYDFTLCRLANPENFAPYNYPPLTVKPTTPTQADLKWGQLLAFGLGENDNVFFVDFTGRGFGDSPFLSDAAHNDTISIAEAGDSGGPAFWFSPTSFKPAFVGLVRKDEATLQTPAYFSSNILTWINGVVTNAGDDPLQIVSTAAHYGGPTLNPPPDLSAKPNVALSGSSTIVSWTAPKLAAGDKVDGYKVSYGAIGRLDGKVTLASTATSTTLTARPVGPSLVCVIPYNTSGDAANQQLNVTGTRQFQMKNCRSYNTSPPGPVRNLTFTVGPGSSASSRLVTGTWQAALTPADVTTAKYTVVEDLTYGTGPTYYLTRTFTTGTWTVSATKGGKVCFSVTPISDLGVTGTQVVKQCVVAN